MRTEAKMKSRRSRESRSVAEGMYAPGDFTAPNASPDFVPR
jgi:hypothetical protein